jgi:hypothetical protein
VSDVPDFTPPGWLDAVEVSPGVSLVRYPGDVVRVRHRCNRAGRGGGDAICAPKLSPGHIVQWPPAMTDGCNKPTVSPSILCADCGLHGFVVNGEWMSA